MMKVAIRNFAQQFAYQPRIENADRLPRFERYIVVGMGGSHLAADLLKTWNPYLDILIHQDYGLPPLPDAVLEKSLIIASSYSGNTEEVIDAFETAREKHLALAAISVGGKLLELARRENVPFIQLPDTGIQPRSALGLNFKALLKLLGEETALEEASALVHLLDSGALEHHGRELAARLHAKVPIIYASQRNAAVAYNWKIKFNETGKIPAFYNTFPELNHNEMTGFDVSPPTRELSERFYFLFLQAAYDDRRILKRMEVLEKLYRARALPVEVIAVSGENLLHAVFSSLLLADWAAYYTAVHYGVEPEQVPMVEEFKKLVA